MAVFSMWTHELRQELLPCGLSVLQFRVLNRLAQRGGNMEFVCLAQELQISLSSLRYTLNKLEGKTFIRKNRSPKEGNTDTVHLLPAGAHKTEQSSTAICRLTNRLTSPLGGFLIENFYRMASDYLREYREESFVQLQTSNRECNLTETGAVLTDAILFSAIDIIALLKAQGLSLTGFRVLFELSWHSHGIRHSDLTHQLLMPAPDLTDTVRKLRANNYVLTNRQSFDRRNVILEITNTGYDLIYHLAPQVDDYYCRTTQGAATTRREFILKTARLMTTSVRKEFRSTQ